MSSISSLERQIKNAWRYYKVRSNDCHSIAKRVENRKRAGVNFAFPEEIKEYDEKAKELREVEGYIAVRQKELNKYRKSKQDYKFNQQQVERLTESLKV